ncbi:hypothetical protein GR160_17255 [Flavobacterium sp. Sd200]|uniref:hypothetical protein n=1 Tax=Flavobacterium sp. Sd200 TaxID=2692211 RepID=UPI00136CE995|nr:hypothetical protein [Flavobacterium sp. Sd200]MXN92976.1 hypothetical protein [Flavobacterium sp. Sd200]
MKNLNPFFTIGTVGMIVISLLHIAFALILSLPVHTVFFALYPVFAAFMALGFVQIKNNQKKLIPIRVKK